MIAASERKEINEASERATKEKILTKEKIYAYKVTIKGCIVETDDLDLVLNLLKETGAKVDSDLPNRNICKEWEELVKNVKRKPEIVDTSKQVLPYLPWPTIPYTVPYTLKDDNKLVITC